MANEQEYDRVREAEEQRLGRTVGGRYVEEDSIEADAYKKRDKKQEREEKETLKQEEEELIQSEEAVRYAEAVANAAIANAQESSRMAMVQSHIRQKKRLESGVVKGGVKGARVFARWAGIGIAATAFFWQFIFGLISLIGFGGQAIVTQMLDETWWGKALKFVTGFFFDISKLVPMEYLGFIFWALATIVALMTFFAFLIFFYITGVRVFSSTMSLFITALVFACCILPVANLFPAVLVWIIYTNAVSMTELFRGRA